MQNLVVIRKVLELEGDIYILEICNRLWFFKEDF